MSEETIKAFLAVNTTTLGIAITYLLTKGFCSMNGLLHFERKDWSRSAAIHYMRIEEARDYLDTFLSAFRNLGRTHRSFLYFWKSHDRAEDFEEVLWLIDAAAKKRFHIHSLNDSVLTELDEKLVRAVGAHGGSLAEVIRDLKGHPDQDKELFLENIAEEYHNALAFIRAMEARLDELTETLS